MALLVAKDISSAVARGLWRAMVPSYVRAGLSFNASLLDFRHYYPSFRRNEMLSVWRGVQGLIVGQSRQSAYSRDKRIPESAMPSFSALGRERFRVYYTYDAHDPLTGITESRQGSWYTNRYYSPDAWARTVWDELDQEVLYEDTEIQNVQFQVVQRNSAWEG